MKDKNKNIFSRDDIVDSLNNKKTYRYDLKMDVLRRSLIQKYITNDSFVLDIGCGTGRFAIPILGNLNVYYGIDFSEPMINDFQRNIPDRYRLQTNLVNSDFLQYNFKDKQFDCIFSFGTLYYIKALDRALLKISRLLAPGGVAIIELGNKSSINSPVNDLFYKTSNWPKPQFTNINKAIEIFAQENLKVLEHRCFQLFPMYGSPNGANFLKLFCTEKWKYLLHYEFRSKMLDEYISSSYFLKQYAFRHIFILEKLS